MNKRLLAILSASLIVISIISCSSGETEAVADANTDNNITLATAEAGNSSLAQWTAKDADGVMRSSDEWLGKQPVVFNFWGTWCPPCRREIPDMVRIYDEYKPKGVEIVSIAIRDNAKQVLMFAGKANMKWELLMTNEEVQKKLGLSGAVPTTIFFDKDGNEKARFVGMRNYAAFKEAIESII